MRMMMAMPIVAGLLLVGCGEEIKSVEYYKAHLDEARDKQARCMSNADAGENCGNASVAIIHAAREQAARDRAKTAKALKDGTIWPTWNGK